MECNVQLIHSNGYTIYIGKDSLDFLSEYIKNTFYDKLFILVDENTFHHCLPLVYEQIELFKIATVIEIPTGDNNKTIETSIDIWSKLNETLASRDSFLINIGGGVVTDIGGFVASTYRRGIKYINVPTSLLAQVDAGLGGKTAVNINSIKNQLGTFYNPSGVFIYPSFLKSLPKKELNSAFSEIIKIALLSKIDFWYKIKSVSIKSLEDWSEIIYYAVFLKNNIIVQDWKEDNIRKILNFGHSVGHAIETFSLLNDKVPIPHGDAVAFGLVCELYLSHKLLDFNYNVMKEICNFIFSVFNKYYIPIDNYNDVIELMLYDKKNTERNLNIVLLKSIGNAILAKNIKREMVFESIKFYYEP